MIYLIPIGGTGIRVTKSLVQLCKTGCFAGYDFKIMCIDSDDVNGDVKELERVIKNYKKLSGDIFAEIKLAKIEGEERCVWSPLSVGKKKDKRSSMSDMVLESQMSKDAKKILQYLYTKPEREKILEGGFYGHTSIGSYFMAQEVAKGKQYTEVWHDFFDGKKDDDKIFIIGSVFGGTGASGVPTIARIIKDNPETASLPIGALLVMPYFKPGKNSEEDEKLSIDWTTFTTKTKTALAFYLDQQFDEIFDTMYFIGEEGEEDFMWVEYNDCGIKQKNKSNPIEVFAATSVLDFVSQGKNEKLVTKFLEKENSNSSSVQLTQSMLNEIADKQSFTYMKKFLKFSILYVKYLYPCICQGFAAENWFSCYKRIESQEADAMKEVCCDYIEWIKELVVCNDTSGKIDYDEENHKLEWFWYKNIKEIYDTNLLLKGKERLFSKHKVYDLEPLNDLETIVKGEKSMTGRELIAVFANEKASRRGNRTTTDLKQLMLDIMDLC